MASHKKRKAATRMNRAQNWFFSLVLVAISTPVDGQNPTPYWTAPDGLSYDLRGIFSQILKFRVHGDSRRHVDFAFGASVPCSPETNPRRVAACLYDVDSSATVLGLKSEYRFESLQRAEGFRLWYEHNDVSFAIDFECNDAEFPETLGFVERVNNFEITGFVASYFGRISSVVGCGYVLPGSNEDTNDASSQSTPETTFSWVAPDETRRIDYTVKPGEIFTELDPPHSLDAIEISLAAPIVCGSALKPNATNPGTTVCLHRAGKPSVSAGLASTMQLRRAHTRGVDLTMYGTQCTSTREYRTTVFASCETDEDGDNIRAWRNDCEIFVEFISPFGCGVETIVRTKDVPAQTIETSTTKSKQTSQNPKEEHEIFRAPHGVAGCVEGDCTDGLGTFRWLTGSVYTGMWKAGQRHGEGVHSWPDGRRYNGNWSFGVRSGYGEHLYRNGDTYIGQWQEDSKHGSGKYRWSNGGNYVGTFENDQSSGFGQRFWKGGAYYEGMVHDGNQHGYGRMTWPNGTVWVGEWHHGAPTDDGMLLCSQGLLRSETGCVKTCPSGYLPSHGECILVHDDL